MQIKLIVDGGDMKPGPAIAQQLGPLGINIGQVISKINQSTSLFKGIKVPVVLEINPKTKDFTIEIKSPPTSELLKKELGLEKGSGDHKKNIVGNASIEQVIKISKTKYENMLARDFKSAVKSVIGSCTSLGVYVENKPAFEISQEIDQGIFDKEIKSEKTETSIEKLAELKNFMDDIVKKQEAAKKAEEEAAKAAEEAAKATAKPGEVKEGEAAATATPAAGAKPAEAGKAVAPATGAKPVAAGKAPAKGKEEKKK